MVFTLAFDIGPAGKLERFFTATPLESSRYMPGKPADCFVHVEPLFVAVYGKTGLATPAIVRLIVIFPEPLDGFLTVTAKISPAANDASAASVTSYQPVAVTDVVAEVLADQREPDGKPLVLLTVSIATVTTELEVKLLI